MTYLLHGWELHLLILTACFLDNIFQSITIVRPIDNYSTCTRWCIIRIQRPIKLDPSSSFSMQTLPFETFSNGYRKKILVPKFLHTLSFINIRYSWELEDHFKLVFNLTYSTGMLRRFDNVSSRLSLRIEIIFSTRLFLSASLSFPIFLYWVCRDSVIFFFLF